MSNLGWQFCKACQGFRPPGELLRVSDRRVGGVFYVCKPNGGPMCFAQVVAGRDVHRVEEAHVRTQAPIAVSVHPGREALLGDSQRPPD